MGRHLETLTSKSVELDLETPQLTRIRRPPRRLELTVTVTASCQYNDLKTKHKIQYLQLTDLLVTELDRCFDQPDMSNVILIERVVTGRQSQVTSAPSSVAYL